MRMHTLKFDRLIKLDASHGDYPLLDGDRFDFLGDYYAYRGFATPMNDLIINFKKPMSKAGQLGWHYKAKAIEIAAQGLATTFGGMLGATFVPIPPSSKKGDPEYDDRLLKTLQRTAEILGEDADIRELVIQQENTIPAHLCSPETRPTRSDLIQIYKLDNRLIMPEPQNIVIFDDVLTRGTHYAAAKHCLQAVFPNARYFGVTIARTSK